MNVVTLIGRLGNDPETKYSGKGTAVTNMSLATSDGFGDNKKTNWHRIVAFGKTAELCKEYLKKGSLVGITGRLDYNKWEDSEGNKRTTPQVIVNNVEFLDPKGGNGQKKSEDTSNNTDTPPADDADADDLF